MVENLTEKIQLLQQLQDTESEIAELNLLIEDLLNDKVKSDLAISIFELEHDKFEKPVPLVEPTWKQAIANALNAQMTGKAIHENIEKEELPTGVDLELHKEDVMDVLLLLREKKKKRIKALKMQYTKQFSDAA